MGVGLCAPPIAIFEERAKHPVFLVGAVEESANVTLPAEIAPGELYGMTLGCHISPQSHGHRSDLQPPSRSVCRYMAAPKLQRSERRSFISTTNHSETTAHQYSRST